MHSHLRHTTCGAPPKKLVVRSNLFGKHLLGEVIIGNYAMVGWGSRRPHDPGQDLLGKAH